MSNHFPAVPTDAGLSGITYRTNMSDFGQIAPSSPLYSASMSANIDTAGYFPTFNVAFPSPGNHGTFDQDVYEAALVAHIGALCAEFASALGVAASEVRSSVSIQRIWTWGSPADNPAWQANTSDTLAFPA